MKCSGTGFTIDAHYKYNLEVNMRTKLKGLSLVEVLVASLIMVIVIVSVMMMFSVYNRVAIDNEAYFIAENELRQVFEELNTFRGRDQVYNKIGPRLTSVTGITYPLGAPGTFTREGTNGVTHTFTIQYSLVGTNVFSYSTVHKVCRVIATISWGTGSVLTMETIVYA